MGDFVQNSEVEAIRLEIFYAFKLLREAYLYLAIRLHVCDVHVDLLLLHRLLVFVLWQCLAFFLFSFLDLLDDSLSQSFDWTSYEPYLLGYSFSWCCESRLEAESIST